VPPSAEQAGSRIRRVVELILGCPGALPEFRYDPGADVEERIARGAGPPFCDAVTGSCPI